MDDVVGQVVLAVGDPDLLTGDAVRAGLRYWLEAQDGAGRRTTTSPIEVMVTDDHEVQPRARGRRSHLFPGTSGIVRPPGVDGEDT